MSSSDISGIFGDPAGTTDDDSDTGGTGGGGGDDNPASLTRGAILGALGISTGAWAALVAFAEEGPRAFIRGVIVDYLWETLVRPAAVAFFESGVAVIDSVLVIFLGGDRAVGIAPGSAVGLLDVPFAVSRPLNLLLVGGAAAAVAALQGFNEYLASLIVSQLGIAAPPVVAFLWGLEIGGALWLAWIAIQTVDVFAAGTIDSIIDIGRAVAAPFVNFFRGLT